MPVHDWSRVKPGVFHDFHVEWTSALKHALNHGILPPGYYSMVEQYTSGFEADVLTLESSKDVNPRQANGSTTTLAKPRRSATAESEMEFYRRKKKVVAIRDSHDDGVIAIIEIVSPGNKSGVRPPQIGIKRHDIVPTVRAFVEHFAIGQELPAMPLFLEPDGCVDVPLEATYCEAFAEVPQRWRQVLEG